MQRMVMDGVKEYGVTTMYMEQGLDTGDMLERWKTVLKDEDDFGSVHDTLAREGAELLLSTLRKAEKGTLTPEKQDDGASSYAAKIEKQDCLVVFDRSARAVHNQIRGLSPVPLAYTFLRGKILKIVKTSIEEEEKAAGAPGQVLAVDKNGVLVACGKGILRLQTVKPEGKGMMSAYDLAKGRGISPEDRLG